MRHALLLVAVGLLLAIATSGCGPNVSRSDLGTIVSEVPTVAGADEPYRFPIVPNPQKESMAMGGLSPMTAPPAPPPPQSDGNVQPPPKSGK